MSGDRLPIILGVVLAIGITTTMDATGYAPFSALPLMPLFFIFWWWQKFSRAEIGFKWGRASEHAYALAYPVVVMSILAAIAAANGSIDTADTDWNKALLNVFVGAAGTILVGLLTEEGFFRGWLWAALKKTGLRDPGTLLVTSLIFMAWHIPVISLETGFDVPARQIPIYLVNATLIGLNFGLLRQWSGSIVVASVCHGVWNGLAYSLFGFGERVGALGITETWFFGPEVGLLGIVLNLGVALAFWRKVQPASEVRVMASGLS
jgi:membrane protease YdiL (CAAX protease family)